MGDRAKDGFVEKHWICPCCSRGNQKREKHWRQSQAGRPNQGDTFHIKTLTLQIGPECVNNIIFLFSYVPCKPFPSHPPKQMKSIDNPSNRRSCFRRARTWEELWRVFQRVDQGGQADFTNTAIIPPFPGTVSSPPPLLAT